MRLNETEEEFDARIEEYVEVEEQEAGLINAIEERDEENNLCLFILLFLVDFSLCLGSCSHDHLQSFLTLKGSFHLKTTMSSLRKSTYLKIGFNSVAMQNRHPGDALDLLPDCLRIL